MANGFPGFDPTISLGVEPLTSLYSGGTVDRPEPTTPLVEEDSRKREMLARILLGLSTFGGHKAPSFLSEELRERSKERATQATEARKVGRLRASAGFLGQAREAEARGDDAQASQFYRQALGIAEDPQVAKEIMTALGQASGRRRVGGAASRVNEFVIQTGVEALDHSARLAIRTELLSAGMPEPHVEAYLKGLETRWEQSKDGRTMIGTRSDKKEPWQVPMETLTQLGSSLIRLKGTQVKAREGDVRPGVVAETPETLAVSPGQEIVEKPGVWVLGGPAVPGAAPAPAPGAIQPTGGEPLRPETPGAPEGGTLKVLRPATLKKTPLGADNQLLLRSVGVGKTYVEDLTAEEAKQWKDLKAADPALKIKPTAEQAAYLSKRGIPTNLSWNEIRQKYPNAAETYFRDREDEEVNRSVARVREQKAYLASIPFVTAFPQSARVPFSRETRQRDETLSVDDITAKKGTLLDPESARSVAQMSAALPSLVRLRDIAASILAKQPGANLGRALSLAVQSGLASNEDLAVFEALQGTLGLQIAVAIQGSRPSDVDAQAVRQSFPTTRDTGKTAVGRLNSLIQQLNDSMDARLGKPVGVLTKESLMLRESIPGSPKPGGGTFDRRSLRK